MINTRASVLLLAVLLSSCFADNTAFTPGERAWFTPFKRDDTVVFRAKEGLADTIVFFKARGGHSEVRSLERGFYDTEGYSVPYQTTAGSFHQPYVQEMFSQDPDRLVSLSKSSDGRGASGEVSFLGLLFDIEDKDSFSLNHGVISFVGKNAKYTGTNWRGEVDGFLFDVRKGVMSYWDKQGRRWERVE